MNDTQICPFCGEEIPAKATKCKYCREWLVEPDGTAQAPAPTPQPAVAKKTYSKPYISRTILITLTILAAAFSVFENVMPALGILTFLFDAALAAVGILVISRSGVKWQQWGIAYFIFYAVTALLSLFVVLDEDFAGVSFIVFVVGFLVTSIGLIVALNKNGQQTIAKQWLWAVIIFGVCLVILIVISVIGADVSEKFVAKITVYSDILLYIVTFNLLDKVNSEEKETFIDKHFDKILAVCAFAIVLAATVGIVSAFA